MLTSVETTRLMALDEQETCIVCFSQNEKEEKILSLPTPNTGINMSLKK